MDKKRDRILTKIGEFIKKYKVEKAIVFGSAARGEMREDSDIDIILVSEGFEGESALRRPVRFYIGWDLDYPVDFLCYTPKEFDDLKMKATIVREAVKEGVEVAG